MIVTYSVHYFIAELGNAGNFRQVFYMFKKIYL